MSSFILFVPGRKEPRWVEVHDINLEGGNLVHLDSETVIIRWFMY